MAASSYSTRSTFPFSTPSRGWSTPCGGTGKVGATLRTADPAAAQKILTRALGRLTAIVQDYPEAIPYQSQLARLQTLAK